MDELFVEDRITDCSPQEMYEALHYAWYIVFGDGNPKHESLLVLLSHWALETGEGNACHCWNIGNIKRVPGHQWTMLANVWEMLDKVPQGASSWVKKGDKFKVIFNPPHAQTHFMAFSSLEEGCVEYMKKQHGRYAVAWPAVESGDPVEFARLLKKQRYYSGDLDGYIKLMMFWFRAYAKKIQRYEMVV